MSLWHDLAEAISSGRNEAEVEHALGEAGFLFEKSTGHPPDELWSEQVAGADLDEAGRTRLRDVVATFVRTYPHHRAAVTGFWALGKLEDRSLLALYRWALTYYLEHGESQNRHRGSSALFGVPVALSNLGERPFGDFRGSGSLDVERNRGLARAYLARTEGT